MKCYKMFRQFEQMQQKLTKESPVVNYLSLIANVIYTEYIFYSLCRVFNIIQDTKSDIRVNFLNPLRGLIFYSSI